MMSLTATPQLPIRGWSSWTQFRCHVNETLVLSMADAVVSSGLRDSGYEYPP
jgi:alpha-galactosidase